MLRQARRKPFSALMLATGLLMMAGAPLAGLSPYFPDGTFDSSGHRIVDWHDKPNKQPFGVELPPAL